MAGTQIAIVAIQLHSAGPIEQGKCRNPIWKQLVTLSFSASLHVQCKRETDCRPRPAHLSLRAHAYREPTSCTKLTKLGL